MFKIINVIPSKPKIEQLNLHQFEWLCCPLLSVVLKILDVYVNRKYFTLKLTK